jgi:hypothetical protein
LNSPLVWKARTPVPWITVVCSLSLSSAFQYTLASVSEFQMVRNMACCSSSSIGVFGGEPVRTVPEPMDSNAPMRPKSISWAAMPAGTAATASPSSPQCRIQRLNI